MTPTRATVLAALVAALGLTAMSPAFASDQHRSRPGSDNRTLEFRRDASGGAFRFVDFSCSTKAPDRMEHRLDRMAGRLNLSQDQQKLFDDFRTSALTAQTSFADQCATIRPAPTADSKQQRPDLVQRLEQRLKLDEARLTAMTDLLPQFKTFYASLNDQQKQAFTPGRMMQGMKMRAPHSGMNKPAQPAAPATGDNLDG